MSNIIRLIALTTCAAFTGCTFLLPPQTIGSGVAKSEDRSISEVTKIHLNSVGTLVLKQSDKESLTVKGDDNIVPLMRSSVANGTLTLGLADNSSVQPKTAMEYVVEVKAITSLQITGAAIAKVSALDGKTLVVNLTGACQATLQGKIDSLQLNATGASSCDAAELSCKSVTVKVTGASNVTVYAESTLDATATGACTVKYLGDPKVTKNIAGTSSIKKR